MTPKDISIRMDVLTIEDLLDAIGTNKLILRSDVHLPVRLKDRSYFIESIFLNIPMIPFVIDGRYNKWAVVDGNKRLLILYKFYCNTVSWRYSKFITGIEFPKKFSQLSLFMQRRFLNCKVPCYIINPGTPYAVAKEIKERYQNQLS